MRRNKQHCALCGNSMRLIDEDELDVYCTSCGCETSIESLNKKHNDYEDDMYILIGYSRFFCPVCGIKLKEPADLCDECFGRSRVVARYKRGERR